MGALDWCTAREVLLCVVSRRIYHVVADGIQRSHGGTVVPFHMPYCSTQTCRSTRTRLLMQRSTKCAVHRIDLQGAFDGSNSRLVLRVLT
jgi:hypothetical protein